MADTPYTVPGKLEDWLQLRSLVACHNTVRVISCLNRSLDMDPWDYREQDGPLVLCIRTSSDFNYSAHPSLPLIIIALRENLIPDV